LKLGDVLEFKVIDIEPESHRFGLSLKALKPNPNGPVDSKQAAKMDTDLRQIGLSNVIIAKLSTAGINDMDALSKLGKEELQVIPGIGDKTAEKIVARIEELKKS
jgi:ribosomal protein S1